MNDTYRDTLLALAKSASPAESPDSEYTYETSVVDGRTSSRLIINKKKQKQLLYTVEDAAVARLWNILQASGLPSATETGNRLQAEYIDCVTNRYGRAIREYYLFAKDAVSRLETIPATETVYGLLIIQIEDAVNKLIKRTKEELYA